MRGINEPQGIMFHCFTLDSRVPQDHPLRIVKEHTDTLLKDLSVVFEEIYSTTGRPSVSPERLLKAQLLKALFSIRTDRLFCETLDYNILFRCFLDMNLELRIIWSEYPDCSSCRRQPHENNDPIYSLTFPDRQLREAESKGSPAYSARNSIVGPFS